MRSGLLVFLLFVVSVCNGQEEYKFEKGLVVSGCHRYGREAIVSDQLAYRLHTATMEKPVENGKLFTDDNGNDIRWKSIQVDSTGKFRGEALMNSYLYLTYHADRPGNALLNVSGNVMCYFNGIPHAGDIYGDGWMKIPVQLKKGLNELLIRCGNFSRWQGVSARIIPGGKPVMFSTEDITLPHIVVGKTTDDLFGAIVIINNAGKSLQGATITATLDGKIKTTPVPEITPLTTRKVPFNFDASSVSRKGEYECNLQLKQDGRILDERSIKIAALNAGDHHSYTFISKIDGSVQYYSVAPRTEEDIDRPALFLSVHGAGVEAIGQARAYHPKNWGVLVAPTNRRPRGFNWEDWGRIDALEVLALATEKFNPDPKRIYLTGHSMGGHGTWYLGATYPDKWAAIAPCAGYPTLTGYGSADGKIPEKAQSDVEKILLRASNASNVIDMAKNYKNLGVYIHHGDSDKVVSVNYARQMRGVLGEFHSDFSYYEYPGGSHWFGAESVDWPPLFDFFKWHTIEDDSLAGNIEFVTANPAISSGYRWASVIQQERSLEYSKIQLTRNRKTASISGSTKNVAMLKLELDVFDPGDTISILLDTEKLRCRVPGNREMYLSKSPRWRIEERADPKQKNDLRSGTFKEAFNHAMIFVYGTSGNAKENSWAYNKARYDAQVWYYRGNGSVEIIPDTKFSAAKYPDRGVVIYGNSITNSAWDELLGSCPVKVNRGSIVVGANEFKGEDLGAYFTWPRHDSDIAMIAVITGTGLQGMNATEANQYFAAGSGFPDYMIFSIEMLRDGAKGIKAAGFYNNKWELAEN